jgi:small subunit ribosomal protein S6
MEKTQAYETIFVLDPTLSEEDNQALVTKFKTLVEENGTIESVDDWGKRRLAYPINDLTDGYYTLINFSSDPDFPAELDRVYKITEGVLRTIIIRKDK